MRLARSLSGLAVVAALFAISCGSTTPPASTGNAGSASTAGATNGASGSSSNGAGSGSTATGGAGGKAAIGGSATADGGSAAGALTGGASNNGGASSAGSEERFGRTECQPDIVSCAPCSKAGECTAISCDEPADCPGGACCATLGTGGGGVEFARLTCQPSCNQGQYVICATKADCPSAYHECGISSMLIHRCFH